MDSLLTVSLSPEPNPNIPCASELTNRDPYGATPHTASRSAGEDRLATPGIAARLPCKGNTAGGLGGARVKGDCQSPFAALDLRELLAHTLPDAEAPPIAVLNYLAACQAWDSRCTHQQKLLRHRMGQTLIMWQASGRYSGPWKDWVKDNCPFSHEKACYYMRFAAAVKEEDLKGPSSYHGLCLKYNIFKDYHSAPRQNQPEKTEHASDDQAEEGGGTAQAKTLRVRATTLLPMLDKARALLKAIADGVPKLPDLYNGSPEQAGKLLGEALTSAEPLERDAHRAVRSLKDQIKEINKLLRHERDNHAR